MAISLQNLHRILFLDIETATIVPQYDQLDETLQDHWDQRYKRYAAYTHADKELIQSPEAYFDHKAAIYAEYAKVICISIGYIRGEFPNHELRVKTIKGDDEFELLTEFSAFLYEFYYDRYNHYLCGHNIREFDIPFICRRMIINQMRLPNLLNIMGAKTWETSHLIDTLDLWKFGDYKHYTSLDLLCQVLGVESPKSSISGQDVSRLYWSGELDDIASYCERDVRATMEVYLKCINSGRDHEVSDVEEE
jgi:predicted PolB exonuclease-like 3'-5' exonuclease